jgi:tRNA(adenine34) deaminase
MTLARQVATQALPVDVPVGCVVLWRNQLIATGYNQRERHHNPAGHAEVLALQQAAQVLGQWRLRECVVVVTLEPCPMCASLLSQAQVAHVVYGAGDALAGACGSRYTLWQGPTTADVQAEACQQLLQQFFKQLR